MCGQSLLSEKQKFVLTKIQETYNPNAIIAGGALRDYYYNKPIKDTDIFVTSNENKNLCKWLEETFPQTIGLKEGEDIYDYQHNPNVYGNLKSVLTFSLGEDQFQIIWGEDDPKVAVEKKFNFTINQIMSDGGEDIKLPRFMETEKKKQIFFVRGVNKLSYWEFPIFDRKMLALTKKYPEFVFHPLQLKVFNELKSKISSECVPMYKPKLRERRPADNFVFDLNLMRGVRVEGIRRAVPNLVFAEEEVPNVLRPGDQIDQGIVAGGVQGQLWRRGHHLYRYVENQVAWVRQEPNGPPPDMEQR